MPPSEEPDDVALSASAAGPAAGAWHADPTGRFALRWWDGSAWTAHVSTDGTTADDPLEPSPDLLDATSLAFDLTASGLTGEGTWAVWDRDRDEVVGSVVVSWGPGLVVRTSYTVLDGAGRVLCSLDRSASVGWLGLTGVDHLGRPGLRAEARGLGLTLHALQSDDPGAPEATWATGQASGLRWTDQGRRLDGQPAADLVAYDGTPAGSIRASEPDPPHPYRPGEGPTWVYLDRPADLPPQLRALGVVAVLMVALMATDVRDGQRRRHNRRD